MGRLRSVTSTTLLVLVGFALPVGILAAWAQTTIYDSSAFSERAVSVLDSPAVRRELADRLTEQLARSGNQNAIAFRPAVELAIETVVDTDTFRSIFRTAIRRTHEALLQGGSGSTGLDLSDSFAIVTASLQAPSGGKASSSGGLGQSLADVTKKLGDLHIWDLDAITSTVAIVGARRRGGDGRAGRRAQPRSPAPGGHARLGAGHRRRGPHRPAQAGPRLRRAADRRTTRCPRPSRGRWRVGRRTSTPWRSG